MANKCKEANRGKLKFGFVIGKQLVKKGQTNELYQMQIELFVKRKEIERFRSFAQNDKECAK